MIMRLIALAFLSVALVAARADDTTSAPHDLTAAQTVGNSPANAPSSNEPGAPDEWVVRPPDGWTSKQDGPSKVIFLRPPDAVLGKTSSDVEIVVMPARDFTGTAVEWHDAMVKFAQRDGRLLDPVDTTPLGSLLVSTLHLVDASGTEQRQTIYTAKWGQRAQAFVFLATREKVFSKYRAVAEQAIEAAVTPTVEAESRVPMPNEFAVPTPNGWSRHDDAQNRSVYFVPADASSVNDAALIAFPAVDFNGSAEDFHRQAFANLTGGGRQLEQVAHGPAGPCLVSVTHFVSAKGMEVRAILYTTRWGHRAQAFLFAAARADLFKNDSNAASQAVVNLPVPLGPLSQQNQTLASSRETMKNPNSRLAPGALVNSGATNGDGDTMPILNYKDPPNFGRGGGKNFAEYYGSDINFTLCVYPFREVQGDPRAAFQQTLLRDWIDVMYREQGVAGSPQFSTNNVPGADGVIEAHFLDGRQQQHHRILIVAGHWAAIVDMIAPTAFAWQKGYASAALMLQTMQIGHKAAPPSVANGPGPEGARLAGLYQGIRGKTVSNLMLGPGYLGTKTALHFYLLSADGRVYRCYDFPPGGSEAAAHQFDFDGAERQDPGNSGRFAIRGNQLYLKMGGPNADEITTTVSDLNTLQLEGVAYTRKF